MTSAASDVQFEPGIGAGGGARAAVLVASAVITAALLAALGVRSIVVLPIAVGAVAILANPELGLYALLLALALPIPIHVGPVVVYPHDGAAVLTIVSAFVMALRRRDLPLPSACFLVPAACLLLSHVLSLINAQDLTAAGTEVVQQFYLLILAPIGYFLLLRDRRILRRATKLFMALITAEALLICAQFLLAKAGSRRLIEIFAFERHTFFSTRVFGTAGPTVGLLLVASSFLWLSRKMSWSWKLAIIALHVFALFATGTRSAMAVFIVTLIFYTLFTRRKAIGLQVMIPALAGVLIFVSIIGASRFMESFMHSTDMRYRFPIDTKALKAVPQHPFVGHGPKASSDLSISIFGSKKIGVENEFVARLYNNGALGLVALLALGCVPVLSSISRMNRNRAAGTLGAAVAAIIVGIYSGGVAGCIFEGGLGQWVVIFYAMMLAATEISRTRQQTTEHLNDWNVPKAS